MVKENLIKDINGIMEKLKIELYTCTWNEEFQLPFALQYWKRLITDESELKVTVYDNMSDDNTVKILSQYDWITVKQFDTNGEMNEDVLTYIRNNCWKGSKADWVLMVDLDEVFYAKDIIGELKKMKEQGVAVVACQWYALIGDDVPKYRDDMLLHQQIRMGYKQHMNHRQGQGDFGKLQLFDPKKVTTMNYSVGMHISYPDAPIMPNFNIYQIHFDKGYGIQWKMEKRRELWNRMADSQKRKGYGYEYGWDDEKMISEYKNNQAKAIDISNL